MTGKRIAIISGGLVGLVVLMAVWAFIARAQEGDDDHKAGDRPTSDMQQRLDQVIRTVQKAGTCGAAAAAFDDGMEILYGGLRPLPSKDLLDQTTAADQAVARNEMRFADALNNYAVAGGGTQPCDAERRRALDLKLFAEQMNEVGQAVGAITQKCGDGDSLDQPPCDELQPLLDEETGVVVATSGPGAAQPQQVGTIIVRGFSVKLRSPAVPPGFGPFQEDVRVTEPIAQGQCAVVFKETRGLMLRLHFDRVTVVGDPWVTTFGVPRGTRIPIWMLQWVPAEYVKEWTICHTGDVEGTAVMNTTVTQRVKQDVPLNFFWRFYPKDP